MPQLFVTSIPVANNCTILGSRYPWHGISLIALLLRWPLAGPGGAGGTREGYSQVSGTAGPAHGPELTRQPALCPRRSVELHQLKGASRGLARPLPLGLEFVPGLPGPPRPENPAAAPHFGEFARVLTSTPLFHSAARAGCAPAADTWTSLRAAALDPRCGYPPRVAGDQGKRLLCGCRLPAVPAAKRTSVRSSEGVVGREGAAVPFSGYQENKAWSVSSNELETRLRGSAYRTAFTPEEATGSSR